MLEWVYDDIMGYQNPNDIIVITQKEFNITGNFKKIELNYYTDGPARTALECSSLVGMDEELIILNCDQRVLDFNSHWISRHSKINNLDASVGVYHSNKPHNSYIRLDNNHLISEIREKVVISNIATSGVHYWSKARLFFQSCEDMIKDNHRVNNEFYMSETFNYLIPNGYRVGPYYFNLHFPIGVPEDLNNFISLGI